MGDTWNPAWSVGTILTGLCSFMVEESKTFGSIECDQLVRKRFARQSGVENLKELFPDLTKEIKEGILEHKTKLESRLEKKDEAKATEDKAQNQENKNQENQAVENQNNQSATSFLTYFMILLFAMLAGMILNGES